MGEVELDLRTHLLGEKMPETELNEYDSLASPTRAWHHPMSDKELVSALFHSLLQSAEAEQRRIAGLEVPDTVAKRNRRETYLLPQRREQWEARALRYLKRRNDIVSVLSTEALYSAVAMQHLIDLDMSDLHLPPERRCSQDTYEDGVNQQFLLDAPRCHYRVDDEEFHLGSRRNEDRPFFSARLVDAVQRATPPSLLSRVTTVMSQTGLAALERASLYKVAVSGGSQKVEYVLTPQDELKQTRGILVSLQVRRKAFSEYLESDNEDPIPCDTDSVIRKAATVCFSIDGDVDVVDFVEEVNIRQDGVRIPEELLQSEIPRGPEHASAANGWTQLLASLCAFALQCTSSCSRRLREAWLDGPSGARTPSFRSLV